ncbi:uncharacterized protein LOC131880727 [Tigriopus californicus]|uniref:uncharacterized protein LOC131880727 n=1 Tax=Tigriopus californicus TaxID=6832 RepID=UPI0027DA3982|nr:uncharacterized protein LOC131880727 [Tigriopus californicus]
MGFQEANDLCQDNDMVLASISTEDKMETVMELTSHWLSCSDADCSGRLSNIFGKVFDYNDLQINIEVKINFRCLELKTGKLSSLDCEALRQPVCEADCSPKDPCPRPSKNFYEHQGRWVFNYFAHKDEQNFEDIIKACDESGAKVSFVKQPPDLWNINWVVRNRGGPSNEMYIGLDPKSLPRDCKADGWTDLCEGLRWLDGTPYERRVVSVGVETNGKSSVGCFIVTINLSTNQTYIKGVNDCGKERAAACFSDCLRPRCPFPRGLTNGHNNWSRFQHLIGDRIRVDGVSHYLHP